MKVLFLSLITIGFAFGQSVNEYEISFENAVHHEASIKATFKNLKDDVLEVRMSRSSPGRYAIHEFAKNVYNVKAFDGKGKALIVTRPNPYQWNVAGHDGTVVFTYTLFGDKGDGTYLQVDETHAHLNMPATFAFARGLDHRPIQIKFNVREDLKWKVATQLKPLGGNLFWAPHLQYFLDSPTEISNFLLHEFEEESNGKKYTIRVALHHTGTDAEATPYFDGVKKIVTQAKAAMGGLPDFDFGTYTFLSCYMPQASGDGMEHRNSTYCVGTFPLQGEKVDWALSTISHEFFHCWNVERIRPAALEPFNFEQANMSGELWFAEGFTNYYGNLIRCRAGLTSQKDYVESLAGTINFVANSPGLKFFNPIEMSYQAPFADAATSIDPNNRDNTYVSYYPYGEVIGLALDLALRNLNSTLSLDDFMKLVWSKHGKTESPYTVRDLQAALTEYTSPVFANEFFGKYIFASNMPDYEKLFAGMGVTYSKAKAGKSYLGASFRKTDAGATISSYTKIGGPAYKAGLESGDIITTINGKSVTDPEGIKSIIDSLTPGTSIVVNFKRLNAEGTATLILEENPDKQTRLAEDAGSKTDAEKLKRRADWLSPRSYSLTH
jgi:predicted metalloprotease with PDZ domain